MSDQQRINEHDCFSRLTEALRLASFEAKRMGHFRPDQAYAWEKLSEVIAVSARAVDQLAMEAVQKGLKQ